MRLGLLVSLLAPFFSSATNAALPRETDRIALAPGTPAFGANRVVLNRRTNRIYIVRASLAYDYHAGHGLSVVDAGTQRLVEGIDLGADFTPLALAVDDSDDPAVGNRVYLLGVRDNGGGPRTACLRVVDGATNTLLPADDQDRLLAAFGSPRAAARDDSLGRRRICRARSRRQPALRVGHGLH